MNHQEYRIALAAAIGRSRSEIGLYNTLHNANAAAASANIPQRVMMLEFGYYGVVSPAVATLLERQGYEYAR